MANSDGTIVLSTRVDTSGLSGFDKKASTGMDKLKSKLEALNSKMKTTQEALTQCRQQLEQLEKGEIVVNSPSITKAQEKMKKLQNDIKKYDDEQRKILERQDQISSEAFYEPNSDQAIIVGADKEEYDALSAKYDELTAKLKEIRVVAEQTSEASQKMASQEKQDAVLQLKNKISELEAKLSETQNEASATSRAIESLENDDTIFGKITTAAKDFGKNLVQVAKRLIVYQTIHKVISYIKDVLKDVLVSNKEFAQNWEELKAAFYTVAYPLTNVLVPALNLVVGIVKDLAVSVGQVIAMVSGMTYAELVNQAKDSKKVADNYGNAEESVEKMSKTLAGFDDLQILSSGATEEESKDEYSGFDSLAGDEGAGTQEDIAEQISAMVTVTAMLLFAVGLICLLYGHVAIGIAFLIGAVAMYGASVILDTTYSENALTDWIAKIMLIAGIALVAIGLILLMFGRLLLGASLLALGAVALVNGIIAANYDAVPDKVKTLISVIMATVSAALLVIGVILLFNPATLPLALALIVAGAAGLVTVFSINKDAIVEWIKDIWEKIEAFWNNHIKKVFTAKFWTDLWNTVKIATLKVMENIVNGIRSAIEAVLNWFIDRLNDVLDLWNKTLGGVLGLEAQAIEHVDFGDVDYTSGISSNTPTDTYTSRSDSSGGEMVSPKQVVQQVVLEVDGREFGRAVVEQGNRESRRVGTNLAVT